MKGNTDSILHATKAVKRGSHEPVDGMRICVQRSYHAIFL